MILCCQRCPHVWSRKLLTTDSNYLAVLRASDIALQMLQEVRRVFNHIIQRHVLELVRLRKGICGSERLAFAEVAVLEYNGRAVHLLGPGINVVCILRMLAIQRSAALILSYRATDIDILSSLIEEDWTTWFEMFFVNGISLLISTIVISGMVDGLSEREVIASGRCSYSDVWLQNIGDRCCLGL